MLLETDQREKACNLPLINVILKNVRNRYFAKKTTFVNAKCAQFYDFCLLRRVQIF